MEEIIKTTAGEPSKQKERQHQTSEVSVTSPLEMRKWMDKHIGPHIARFRKKDKHHREMGPTDQTTKDLFQKIQNKSNEWNVKVTEILKHSSHPEQVIILMENAKKLGIL